VPLKLALEADVTEVGALGGMALGQWLQLCRCSEMAVALVAIAPVNALLTGRLLALLKLSNDALYKLVPVAIEDVEDLGVSQTFCSLLLLVLCSGILSGSVLLLLSEISQLCRFAYNHGV